MKKTLLALVCLSSTMVSANYLDDLPKVSQKFSAGYYHFTERMENGDKYMQFRTPTISYGIHYQNEVQTDTWFKLGADLTYGRGKYTGSWIGEGEYGSLKKNYNTVFAKANMGFSYNTEIVEPEIGVIGEHLYISINERKQNRISPYIGLNFNFDTVKLGVKYKHSVYNNYKYSNFNLNQKKQDGIIVNLEKKFDNLIVGLEASLERAKVGESKKIDGLNYFEPKNKEYHFNLYFKY